MATLADSYRERAGIILQELQDTDDAHAMELRGRARQYLMIASALDRTFDSSEAPGFFQDQILSAGD